MTRLKIGEKAPDFESVDDLCLLLFGGGKNTSIFLIVKGLRGAIGH